MAAHDAGRAIGGFSNDGSSCYANASVQAVARAVPLAARFLDVDSLSNTEGPVSLAMASVMQSILNGAPAASTMLLRRAVALAYPTYGRPKHQDAGLFLGNALALYDAEQNGVVSLAGGCGGGGGKKCGVADAPFLF